MNESYKYTLFAVGGIVLGAVGATLLSREQNRLRPAVADLLSRGLDVKDKALVFAETAKEQLEDIVAEAEDLQQKRSATLAGESATTAKPAPKA